MAQKFVFEDLRLSGELNRGDAIRFLTKASMSGIQITPPPRVVTASTATKPDTIESIRSGGHYLGREHFEDYAAKYEPAMSRNNIGRIFNAAVRSGIPYNITRRRRQIISDPGLTVVHRSEVLLPDYFAVAGESAYHLDQASLTLARTHAVQAQSLINSADTAFLKPSVAEEFLDTLGIVLREQCQWSKSV